MLKLSLACWDYDRTEAILDGRVGVQGCQLSATKLEPHHLFPRILHDQEFDIGELSICNYLTQVGQGDCAYTAIPVFPSRCFRHGAIYVRSDADIISPKDLEGKRVGIPDYAMTAVVWIRGILQDEYSVDFSKILYRVGSVNETDYRERVSLNLPEDMDVEFAPLDRSLNDQLLDGELDALFSPGVPRGMLDKNPRLRTLFDDPAMEEKKYYQRTGYFPIMHIVAIRKSLLEKHDCLANKVFRTFFLAKQMSIERQYITAMATANRSSLPWFKQEFEAAIELMGDNFWSYGLSDNRAQIETLCRYTHEQYLTPHLLKIDEIFESSTLSC